MFSLFKNSSTEIVSVGVDIGTSSIKAVELTGNGKGVNSLSNYALLEVTGHLDHFNNALQSSNLRPLESDLISYLSIIKEHARFKTNHVAVSLPSFSAFTTVLEVPAASAGEISKTVATQVQEYIPLPANDVTFEWIPIGTKSYPDGAKKQQIFLVSIPNEKIENYTKVFNQAGFILDSVEVEHVSIARALSTSFKEPTLIIDIGGRSTAMTIVKKGVALFAGQTDFSSNSLTQALATALNISPRRADSLKRQTTIVGGAGNHELSTILIPIIDVILSEAKRTQDGFESTFSEKVASVIISGSGANMPGFQEYLSTRLNLPVIVADPLSEISFPPEMSAFSKPLGTTLTVAIGLALKKFHAP